MALPLMCHPASKTEGLACGRLLAAACHVTLMAPGIPQTEQQAHNGICHVEAATVEGFLIGHL